MCSCLMFKFPLVLYLTGECHTRLAFVVDLTPDIFLIKVILLIGT